MNWAEDLAEMCVLYYFSTLLGERCLVTASTADGGFQYSPASSTLVTDRFDAIEDMMH